MCFFFQAEDGIRDLVRSRGLGDVYKRQRKQIVLGAVSMVEMALVGLKDRNIIELDPERRAAMIANLLVVLCAETDVQPVINTGTSKH